MTDKRMPDQRVRELLLDLDEDDEYEVSSWEADFLENILYNYDGPLSDNQHRVAINILEKYGYV